MNILVSAPKGYTRDTFINDNIKQKLEKLGNVEYNNSTSHYSLEELYEKLKNTDILITGWGCPLMDKTVIAGTPLKMIVHTGGTVATLVKMDVYDTGVKIISGNRYYAESVAEGTLAYMLFMLRRMDFFSSNLKNNGKWSWLDNEYEYTEGLLDQTVGIISYGAISSRLIQMAKPFNINFKVYSTRPDPELAAAQGFEYASLEEIFSSCKIISVHTARCPETYHMIDAPLFKLIKKDAVFINTSRGDVINEQALIEELKTNRFRALLDVYEKEPLPKDSPLLQLDNVTLFPHQAGPTVDRRAVLTSHLVDDIERFIKSLPLENEITKSVAEKMTY